ncbi:MAG: hypothetical protein IPJ76_06880 [Flavobacteriales bacterium]|nr:MAG: hypothetical protein IPJ76_06880 [Flavobacteriales bacterium]
MGTFLFRLSEAFQRFEHWFNARFGWFFTNGMKSTGRGTKDAMQPQMKRMKMMNAG